MTAAKTLFMAVPAFYARYVRRQGFVGTAGMIYHTDTPAEEDRVDIGVEGFCEFRDRPPAGLNLSTSGKATFEGPDPEGFKIYVGGGLASADYTGDVILSIDVPDDENLQQAEVPENSLQGRPFREYRLPVERANRYRNTLRAWVSDTEEEIAVDLFDQDHAVIVTERALDDDRSPPLPSAAWCVCGARWHSRSGNREELRRGFDRFSAAHRR